MKKLVALLIAVSVGSAIVGCKGSGDEGGTPSSTPTTTGGGGAAPKAASGGGGGMQPGPVPSPNPTK